MNRVLRDRMRCRFIVTLKNGQAFDGLLYQADKQALALRNVTAYGVGPRGEAAPVDGEMVVLLADVLTLQRP